MTSCLHLEASDVQKLASFVFDLKNYKYMEHSFSIGLQT